MVTYPYCDHSRSDGYLCHLNMRNKMSVSEVEFSQEKQFKFVVLGEPASGKTSLVLRYCHDEFSRQYYPTSGVDLYLKRTLIDTHSVRLVIWDVSGHSLPSSLLDKHLYDAHAVLLVFDITNNSSFGKLPSWYNTVMSIISQSQGMKPYIFVIANKCDMEHQRAVPTDKQNKFASENRIQTYNVSTRTGENVALSFQRMVAQILGIKLTKLETEAHQRVVQAEVFISQSHQVPTAHQSTSSVCVVQ